MPDAHFADPRLAHVYDLLDGDRADLEAYVAMVDELGARTVLDIGCGTGTFACMLAARGVRVVGVDPAAASLSVARNKPGADRVRWVHGTAEALPAGLRVDMATMTANVAQVFLGDAEWAATLAGIRAALRPGGWLVFEVRDPAARPWVRWTRQETYRNGVLPDGSRVESWVDVIAVNPPYVSFRTTFVFSADGARVTSSSTLRFRSGRELEGSLAQAGFAVRDVRGAPDRPGLELVYVAESTVE